VRIETDELEWQEATTARHDIKFRLCQRFDLQSRNYTICLHNHTLETTIKIFASYALETLAIKDTVSIMQLSKIYSWRSYCYKIL
jgi:hypothetical protein